MDESITEKDPRAANAKSIPAVYTDAFMVETLKDEGLIRIAFGEGNASNTSRLRFAVMIPKSDAESLANIIQKLIGKTWKDKKEEK